MSREEHQLHKSSTPNIKYINFSIAESLIQLAQQQRDNRVSFQSKTESTYFSIGNDKKKDTNRGTELVCTSNNSEQPATTLPFLDIILSITKLLYFDNKHNTALLDSFPSANLTLGIVFSDSKKPEQKVFFCFKKQSKVRKDQRKNKRTRGGQSILSTNFNEVAPSNFYDFMRFFSWIK